MRNPSKLVMPILLTLGTSLLLSAQSADGNHTQRLLAAHNRERAELGVPALRWNAKLAAGAAQWADRLASRNVIQHENAAVGSGEGESLWIGTAGRYAPEAMVGDWVSEKAHYEHGRFPEVSRTGKWTDVGHYTQIVWRGTGEVGCAIGRGQQADVLVCRYRSAGNITGQMPY